MKPHKWAKEIKAWADGAEIESKPEFSDEWQIDEVPRWYPLGVDYRIKPQQKDTQYLKVYGWLENGNISFNETNRPYLGEIKISKNKNGFWCLGDNVESSIKPQPKEPQYLYVLLCRSDGQLKLSQVPIECHPEKAFTYIGKIKLETEDD